MISHTTSKHTTPLLSVRAPNSTKEESGNDTGVNRRQPANAWEEQGRKEEGKRPDDALGREDERERQKRANYLQPRGEERKGSKKKGEWTSSLRREEV